ncbi:hypothetical protein LTR08_004497 [Meristemomyces frigidus]|nr:hypothetical protein LTR08_004497 [Meristemomyces frigidus]
MTITPAPVLGSFEGAEGIANENLKTAILELGANGKKARAKKDYGPAIRASTRIVKDSRKKQEADDATAHYTALDPLPLKTFYALTVAT